jgi:iron complex outermembrane receptor protein
LRQPDFVPATNAPYRGSFAAPPNAYTGDGSIAYFLRATNTKLRAHVGNGYRAPSLYERFGTFYSSFSGAFSTIGDPRLRPDRSIAFDAGVEQTLIGNRLRAAASYFYTRLQEVVGFGSPAQPDPFGRLFSGYINTGGGLARGVELSVQAAPHRSLNLTAAYTFTNSDERAPRNGVLTALALPKHQFSFVATPHIGRLFINFDLLASSAYLAPLFRSVAPFEARTYRFDGLVKGDLGASYTVPLADKRSLRFFGKADNVFNRRYFEDGFRTPGRVGVGGVAVSF